MSTESQRAKEFFEELSLPATGEGLSFGEIHGIPAMVTVLSEEPFAVMVEFSVRPDESKHAAVRQQIKETPDLPEVLHDLSFSGGHALLSFYNLAEVSNEVVKHYINVVAEALTSHGMSAPPGCVRCGAQVENNLLLVDGHPKRVCAECLEDAAAFQAQQAAELNRPSPIAAVLVPTLFLYAVAAWGLGWLLFDLIVEYFQIQAFWINKLTILMWLIVLGGFGAVLGVPLGWALRKSGIVRKAPGIWCGLIVLAASALGEILYVSLTLFRWLGIFDFQIAFKIMPQIVQQYGMFLIVLKLGGAVMTWLICTVVAQPIEPPALTLDIPVEGAVVAEGDA